MTERQITVDVDNTAQAAYISLRDAPVARTAQITEGVLVDLDEMNIAVGVEVLELAAPIPFEKLANDYHVHSEVIDVLRAIQPSVRGFLLTQSSEGIAPANSPQHLVGASTSPA